jgi:hypothetical protein
MRKIFFFAVTATALVSCSMSKEARTYRNAIAGKWQLKTIVSEGISGSVKTVLFDEADFNCFIGSNWSFTNNNSLGSYTISASAGCNPLKRDFRWSIFEAKDEPKLLQFKRLDSKLKEIDANSSGFRFTIVELTGTTMKLKSDITFEGKPAAFVYNFVRI